jgi:hypothetical protein
MVKVGDKAPEVTLLDREGKERSLAGSLASTRRVLDLLLP